MFNGVSQQSSLLRHPSQCELQENAWPSIATGLSKRSPTILIGKISAPLVGATAGHIIDRDATERYSLIVNAGNILINDMFTGTTRTVTAPLGTAYLTSATPEKDLTFLTVADYTFVLNKSIVTKMLPTLTTGTLAGTEQLFSDLPPTPVYPSTTARANPADGALFRIEGQPGSGFDNYYVKYNAAGDVYVESVMPGVTYKLDPATMPHKLIRNADGTFTFTEITWDNRTVGDDVSNPIPSFIGSTLSDIYFYRNRLGFLSNENLILSRAGSYYNFFSESVTTILDSDPIDASVSNVKVSLLNHAVPFNTSLLLFSDHSQFQLSGVDVLTPKTARLDPVTEFNSSSKSRPVGSGQDAFFVVENENYSSVREYFIDKFSVSNDAADITSHVPNYLPKNIIKLTTSTSVDAVLALSSDYRNVIYSYKFYWGQNEKVQSAWFKMIMDAGSNIINMELIGSRLYLIIQRTDGVFLEYMEMQAGTSCDDVGFLVHLDSRITVTGTFDAPSNTTTWALPYAYSGDLNVILGGAFVGAKGNKLGVTTRPSASTIAAYGNYTAGTVYIGKPYTMRYRFSDQHVKDQKQVSIAGGRLQLRTFTVSYDATGYFRAEVTPSYRPTQVSTYTGKKLGVSAMLIGATTIDSGEFRFPVLSKSDQVTIDLVNDSYLPSTFLSTVWEGVFTLRSRRT
jgi:hypothetical protein